MNQQDMEALQAIRRAIAEQPAPVREEVKACAAAIRAKVRTARDSGILALCLVGAEAQAKVL